MFALPLNRTTRHRLFVCLLLLTGLLAAGAGVLPTPAQPRSAVETDPAHRYGWINAGIGGGRTGIGRGIAAGVPVRNRLFVGGRLVQTKDMEISLGPASSPAATTWDAGPLVGLVEQGRWGHLSLASGVVLVGGRRPDEPRTKSTTLGVPLDAQAFFTPIRYVGIGVHGYANVNPDDNMLGWSLHLQVRIPQ